MLKRLLLAAACLLAGYGTAFSYDVTPILAKLSPSGPGSARTFTVRNPSAAPIALEVSVTSRHHDIDGTEQRQPDDEDFIISPPQMVVPPGQSQNIRIQYIGPADLSAEAAYRLLTTQVPVDFSTDQNSKVFVNYNYEIALYVTPRDSHPDARLAGVETVDDPEMGKALAVTVENIGNARAILDAPTLTLSQNGHSLTLTGDQTAPMPAAMILAGEKRRFLLKRPDGLGDGAMTGEFTSSYVVIQ